MNIKSVKELKKQNESKSRYIYFLIKHGKLKAYERDGYLCYDEDEYQSRKRTVKKGRPISVPVTTIKGE